MSDVDFGVLLADALQYVQDEKEWIFSGAGVVFVASFVTLFQAKVLSTRKDESLAANVGIAELEARLRKDLSNLRESIGELEKQSIAHGERLQAHTFSLNRTIIGLGEASEMNAFVANELVTVLRDLSTEGRAKYLKDQRPKLLALLQLIASAPPRELFKFNGEVYVINRRGRINDGYIENYNWGAHLKKSRPRSPILENSRKKIDLKEIGYSIEEIVTEDRIITTSDPDADKNYPENKSNFWWIIELFKEEYSAVEFSLNTILSIMKILFLGSSGIIVALLIGILLKVI